jgi:hypothetical protein
MTLLDIAKSLFLDTLRHLDIAEAMRIQVRCEDETLHIGQLTYGLQYFRRIVIISIGKAATPMTDALLPMLDLALKRHQAVDAIVIGSTRPFRDDLRIRFFPGTHPFPDQSSIDAADAVLQLLSSCDDRCLVLFLISGGASAMIEKALDERLTVDDVARFYRALVQSGLPITQMNVLRKHFSQVKGGRLAVAAQACLDDYVDLARHRASTYNRAKIGDMQSTQIKIAEASAKIDAARLIMRSNCMQAMADARAGHIPHIPAKTKYRRDGAFAVNMCTEAVSLLFSASGARGLYMSGALQRQFRDAHAINSHLAFNFDAAGTNYGRVALGLPSENLTL